MPFGRRLAGGALTAPGNGRVHSTCPGAIRAGNRGALQPIPARFAGPGVPGGNGQRCRLIGHALLQWNRTADDHEKIIGMGPLISHDELKMDPEELPAETVVMLRLDDFPEPDRNDG